MLRSVGAVEWVADEGLIDAVTAVSGSGPAYVFLLAEAMAAAGAKAGLPADLAMRLARATVSGAGELLRQAPETAEKLRINVTSPKGTTEAALKVLMAADGFGPLLDKGRRSRGKTLARACLLAGRQTPPTLLFSAPSCAPGPARRSRELCF